MCPIKGTIVSADSHATHSWMTWTDPGAVNVNQGTLTETMASIISPTDLGTHTFSITVDSANYPTFVNDWTQTLTVIIRCPVTSIAPTSSPWVPDYTYVLTDPAVTTKALDVVQVGACNIPVTYSWEIFDVNGFLLDADTVGTHLGWISWNGATKMWTFSTSDQTNVGEYTVRWKASLLHPTDFNLVEFTEDFKIYIRHDCTRTQLIQIGVANFQYGVTLTAVEKLIFMKDTISETRLNSLYCGPREYTVTADPSYTWWNINADGVNPTDAFIV